MPSVNETIPSSLAVCTFSLAVLENSSLMHLYLCRCVCIHTQTHTHTHPHTADVAVIVEPFAVLKCFHDQKYGATSHLPRLTHHHPALKHWAQFRPKQYIN